MIAVTNLGRETVRSASPKPFEPANRLRRPKDTSLQSICLPESLETIERAHFYARNSLFSVSFALDCKLTTIARGAFTRCISLASIFIPRSVEELGHACFQDCISLSCLTFESGSKLSRIGFGAFASCSLPSLALPPHLNLSDGRSFTGASIQLITVDKRNPYLRAQGSFVWSLPSAVLLHCASLSTTVTVPAPVAIIGGEAFQNDRIRHICFERDSRISGFANRAFHMCSHITSFSVPASVRSIADRCFEACRALHEVRFEPVSRLSTIGKGTFRDCVSLPGLCIPSSVTQIGAHCFGHLRSLVTIEFESGSHLLAIPDYFCAECKLFRSICVPASVREIGERAFAFCGDLVDVTFEPNSALAVIHEVAFSGCDSLVSLSIPRSVREIGVRAFKCCSALSTVTFEPGSALARIQDEAFRSCPKLASITIPAAVEMIEALAFANCGVLASVTFEPGSRISTVHPFAFDALLLLHGCFLGPWTTVRCNRCSLTCNRVVLDLNKREVACMKARQEVQEVTEGEAKNFDDEFATGYRRALEDLLDGASFTGVCYHCSARIA
jgi:hypothetical protein